MPRGGKGGGGGGGNTIRGSKNDDILFGTADAEIIDGRGGIDTVSYVNSSAGVVVNLAAGSGAGGYAEGDSYSRIENVTGSGFADTLTGDGNANTIDGGGGDDIIDGGGGEDTALISGAYDAFRFEQVDAATVRVINTATGETDFYSNVEMFAFEDQTLSLASLYRGADLEASNLTLSATTWSAGDVIDFSWVVSNLGDLIVDGGASGIYLSTDAEVTTDDMQLALDPATGALIPGASGGGSGAFTVGFDLTPGDYYLAAIADVDGVAAETDEANNVTAPIGVSVLYTPAPDLVITDSQLTDTSWADGDSYQIRYTVTNQGDAATGVFLNRVYVSEDEIIDASDYVLTNWSGSLAAGESQEFIANRAVVGLFEPGDYYLLAQTDDAGQIAERDEANNATTISSFTVLPPDPPNLQIDQMTLGAAEWVAGDTPFVNWRVENTGNEAAAASVTELYLSADATLDAGDLLLDSQSLIALSGGQTRYQYASFTVPDGVASGTYHVIAAVDANDVVSESDEGDNIISLGQVTIVEPPNLVVSGAVVDDLEWDSGHLITVSWSLDNVGGAIAAASTSSVYLSSDQSLGAGDVLLGQVAAVALAGGDSTLQSLSFAAPEGVAPDEYYIAIRADAENAVGESDETDNTVFFGTVTVADQTIYGTEGADILTGTADSDVIRALGGDDLLIWSAGGDLLDGGAGFDTVDFSAKTSFVEVYHDDFSSSPPSVISSEGDVLEGIEGLIGTSFDDLLDLTSAQNAVTIDGGEGADFIGAGAGDDTVLGGGGGDLIYSAEGDDFIDAGAGDDLVAGWVGDDQIWLGDGADGALFALRAGGAVGDGHDTIHDFDPFLDYVYVEYEIGDPAPDLFASLTDTAEGVRIDYAPDSSITLLGVSAADLNSTNLIAAEREDGFAEVGPIA